MIFSMKKRILSAFLSLTMVGTMVASVPFTASAASSMGVSYQVFEQNWNKTVSNFATSGVPNKKVFVQGISVKLTGDIQLGGSLNVKVYQNKKWSAEGSDGDKVGTIGKKQPVEAIKISLDGIEGYSVHYNVYENKKWIKGKDGAVAGIINKKYKVEAIKVSLVKTSKFIEDVASIDAKTVPAGTTLDAIKATLPTTVDVTLDDESTQNVGVTWSCDSYDATKAGTYSFVGTLDDIDGVLNSDGICASVDVTTTGADVTSVAAVPDVTVPVGTASADAIKLLPTTLDVTLSDGTVKKAVAITWTADAKYDPKTAATYTFSGAIAAIDGTSNSKAVAATAKVIVGTPKAAIVSVKPVNQTTLTVVLSTPVDSAIAANFTIAGATVSAASLSTDKTTVTLSVSGLSYKTDYTLGTTGLLVSGAAADFGSMKFTSLDVTDIWTLTETPTKSTITSDGSDNTQITFTLLNKTTGAVDTNANNVVLDLNTTYGTLSNKRITIQNGVATTLLTSEFSNTGVTAKIDAQIIEASGDYKPLIGKVVATTNVTFAPTGSTGTVNTITLTGAESDQCDRVTLFFDKDVSLSNFIKIDASGAFLYNYNGGVYNAAGLAGQSGANETNISDDFVNGDNTIVITQGTNNYKVKGLKPVAGNTKAMVAILDKTTILVDNTKVNVEVNPLNSLGATTKSSTNFTLTDARNPSVTSVSTNGLNQLVVKFSEAIAQANFKIDAFYTKDNAFGVSYGDFNVVTLSDNRDTVTLALTSAYDEDGGAIPSTTTAGYFTAGIHAIQVSSIYDFAAASDANNIGTTQNLTFTVVADTAKPTATVSVESPEQIRVTFNKAVSAIDLANAINTGAIKLQVYDSTVSKYVDASTIVTAGYVQVPVADLVATASTNNSIVIELNTDWTQLYHTSTSHKDYYNDQYQLVIAAGTFSVASNGLSNDAITLPLNYTGSPLNTPDTTSPVISTITQTAVNSNAFSVTMSEPVKLVVTGVEQDNAGNTYAETQTYLGNTTCQFIGTDVNGKTVTFDGAVAGYADTDNGDKVVAVSFDKTATVNPQTIVDAGGSTSWTLVVRSLSDDVGNTAASATKVFTLAKSATVSSAFTIMSVVGALNGTAADTITLTYSKNVQLSGTFDATSINQYTLNGAVLPSGTSISRISAANKTTVVISLPNGTLSNSTNNVLDVNKALVSADGTVLSGATDWPFVVDTTPPDAPAITTAAGTNVTSISGTAEPGSTVTLYAGTTVVGTAITAAAVAPATTGIFTATVDLTKFAQGNNNVTATATDGASNTSAASGAVVITVDTVKPSVSTPLAAAGKITATGSQTLVFSEALSPTSQGEVKAAVDAKYVVTGTTATVSSAWSTDGTTLTVTLGGTFDTTANYVTSSAIAAMNITDANGNTTTTPVALQS